MSLDEALFLLAFVPVIMGMGGNIGSQTATITVRGLATGRIGSGDGWLGRYLWQQAKVGVVLGVTFALIVGVAATLMQQNPWYAVVVGGSMLCAMVLAAMNGAADPARLPPPRLRPGARRRAAGVDQQRHHRHPHLLQLRLVPHRLPGAMSAQPPPSTP